MVSVTGFKSSSIQHDVHFVMSSGFSVRSNEVILPGSTPSSKYGNFRHQKAKMATSLKPDSLVPEFAALCHLIVHFTILVS